MHIASVLTGIKIRWDAFIWWWSLWSDFSYAAFQAGFWARKAGHTLCDFRAISARYQLTLYEKIACDVKPKLTIYVLSLYGPIVEHDLCAHTIRVKYSGSQLPTLARQISNRSFKNKPNIFLWFIIINIIYYQLFITNKWDTYL